jgi:hypothetical protein
VAVVSRINLFEEPVERFAGNPGGIGRQEIRPVARPGRAKMPGVVRFSHEITRYFKGIGIHSFADRPKVAALSMTSWPLTQRPAVELWSPLEQPPDTTFAHRDATERRRSATEAVKIL